MHISQIFCNFVAVLGIVPTATLKHNRVMNKVKVFSCSFEGKRYSILVEPNPKREGDFLFWTYKGRRRLDSWSWGSLEAAVVSIMMEFEEFDRDKAKELIS